MYSSSPVTNINRNLGFKTIAKNLGAGTAGVKKSSVNTRL